MVSTCALILFFANVLASSGVRQVAVKLDGSEDDKLQTGLVEETNGCPNFCASLSLDMVGPDAAIRAALDARCTDDSFKKCQGCQGIKKKKLRKGWRKTLVPCCTRPCANEVDAKKDIPADKNQHSDNEGGGNGVEIGVDCPDNAELENGDCVDAKLGPVPSSCCDDLDEGEETPDQLSDPKNSGHIDERVSEGDILDHEDDVEEITLTPTQDACSGFGNLQAAFLTAKQGSRQYQRSLINERALANNKAAQDAKVLQDLLDDFATKSKAAKGKFGKDNCDVKQSKWGKEFKAGGKKTGYYAKEKGYSKAPALIDELADCCEGPGKIQTRNTGSGSGSESRSGSGSGSGSGSESGSGSGYGSGCPESAGRLASGDNKLGDCIDLDSSAVHVVDNGCCKEWDDEHEEEESRTTADDRQGEVAVLDEDSDEVDEQTPAHDACNGIGALTDAFEKAKIGSRQYQRSLINLKALANNKAAQDAKVLQDLLDDFAAKSKAPEGKFGKANCDLSQSTFGKRFKMSGKSTGYYNEGKGYKKAPALVSDLQTCCKAVAGLGD